MERILQIGVVGSASDLRYTNEIEAIATVLGREISERGYALVFGADKDCDSLPTVAGRAAKKAGGLTIGVTYEKGLEIFDPNACTAVVATGLTRGGGREMVQSLSCDGLIAIAGGSGTLNEVTVAYQANIPVVCMTSLGGWSDKLAGKFLDDRERYAFGTASTVKEAVDKLEIMIAKRQRIRS